VIEQHSRLVNAREAGPAQPTLKSLLGDTSGQTAPPLNYSKGANEARLDLPVSPHGPSPHDPGGRLYGYYSAVLKADMERREVRISGTCVSACTTYLGAKNVCVEPTAVLWFHAAMNPETRQIDRQATLHMATYWPEPVRAWARDVGVYDSLTFTRRKTLTGEDLIAMGVKRCESGTALKK